MSDIQLACPECKTFLEEKSDSYECTKCKKVYSSAKGFVDFLGNRRFYAGEVTQREMQNLLYQIDKAGYEVALSGFLDQNPHLRDYIIDPKRADWISHCLSKDKARCLDIGSGLGNTSEILSKIYDKVFSLEAVMERIEFQKRRYLNTNRSNIVMVRSNALSLPFKDNYFDLVICNGVLEWIGTMNNALHPREAQLLFLREITRILSNSGCLYIGIENRFGLPFLLGAKDHSGLSFTSIMPRWVANFFVKKWGKEGGIYGDSTNRKERRGYHTYTYSLGGYRSLIKSAGLRFKAYWVYPSYNVPSVSGRIGDKAGIKGYVKIFKNSTARFHVLLSILDKFNIISLNSLARLFTPSFLFYCYKSEIKPSFEDIVHNSAGLSSSTAISDERGFKFLLYDNHGNIIKVGRLRRFGKSLPDALRVYDKTSMHDRPSVSERAWLENWVPGNTINPCIRNESEIAVDWLIDFQRRNNSEILLSRDEVLSEASSIIETLRNVPSVNIAEYTKYVENFLAYMSSIRVTKNSEHGDFFHGNILLEGGERKVHIIDWEYYNDNANPLFDFVFFIVTSMYYPNSMHEFRLNINKKGTFSTKVLGMIKDKMNKHFDSDIDIYRLIPYTIMRYMARKLIEGGQGDRSFLEFKKLIEIIMSKN